MSEGFLPVSLFRICGGGDSHHFQLVGDSSLPTQPWSLGAMGCHEGVPQAEPTTRGYLGATGAAKPGDLQPSLGQGQPWCRDGVGWLWQSHKHRYQGRVLSPLGWWDTGCKKVDEQGCCRNPQSPNPMGTQPM